MAFQIWSEAAICMVSITVFDGRFRSLLFCWLRWNKKVEAQIYPKFWGYFQEVFILSWQDFLHENMSYTIHSNIGVAPCNTYDIPMDNDLSAISLRLSIISLREKCPNAEIFLVCIQSECGKLRTRKNSVFGHFSRNVYLKQFLKNIYNLRTFW